VEQRRRVVVAESVIDGGSGGTARTGRDDRSVRGWHLQQGNGIVCERELVSREDGRERVVVGGGSGSGRRIGETA
jgi:hypothetical protein